MSPSKTNRKINILRELLHSVREWHHFYELTWLRSPWETPSLSDPSQMGHPNSQMPPSGLPDVPRCLPDASFHATHMPLRCLPDVPRCHVISDKGSQPRDLCQGISSKGSQSLPRDLSQGISAKGSQRRDLSQEISAM